MGSEVKNTCTVVMHTLGHKHVAKLANGRVGQDTFDIKLEDGDAGGEKSCEAADDTDNHQGAGSNLKERVGASDEIDTSSDHCSGMNECADGSWTFHRIGQPHIERQLCRFRCARDEEQQANSDDFPVILRGVAKRCKDTC